MQIGLAPAVARYRFVTRALLTLVTRGRSVIFTFAAARVRFRQPGRWTAWFIALGVVPGLVRVPTFGGAVFKHRCSPRLFSLVLFVNYANGQQRYRSKFSLAVTRLARGDFDVSGDHAG